MTSTSTTSNATDPRELAVRRVTMNTAVWMGLPVSSIPAAMREAAELYRAGMSVYGSAHKAISERLPSRLSRGDLPPAA